MPFSWLRDGQTGLETAEASELSVGGRKGSLVKGPWQGLLWPSHPLAVAVFLWRGGLIVVLVFFLHGGGGHSEHIFCAYFFLSPKFDWD